MYYVVGYKNKDIGENFFINNCTKSRQVCFYGSILLDKVNSNFCPQCYVVGTDVHCISDNSCDVLCINYTVSLFVIIVL